MTKPIDSMSVEEFKTHLDKKKKDLLDLSGKRKTSGGQFVSSKSTATLRMGRYYLGRQKP